MNAMDPSPGRQTPMTTVRTLPQTSWAEVPSLVILWVLCRIAGAYKQAGTAWMGSAMWAVSHGWGGLARSSQIVTASVTILAIAGAGLRLFARRGANQNEWVAAVALFATGAPFSLLLSATGAWVYLAGLAGVTALKWVGGRHRARVTYREPWVRSLVHESFSILSAACLLGLGWEYNALLLTRALLVAAGIALIGRALPI